MCEPWDKFLPDAPEMDSERREVVTKIVTILKEQKVSFREAAEIMKDVSKEIDYRSSYLHL